MLPLTLSFNVLFLALFAVLLLILLGALSILLSELRPLLVLSQPRGSSSALLFPLLLGSGKLADWQELHALPAGYSNLVFLLDSLSRRKFLVDTGASVSVFHSHSLCSNLFSLSSHS